MPKGRRELQVKEEEFYGEGVEGKTNTQLTTKSFF